MHPKRALCAVFCGSALAVCHGQVVLRNDPSPNAVAGVVIERPAFPVQPLRIVHPEDTHQVTVKFRDKLRARALPDGQVSLVSPQAPEGLREVIARHGLAFRPTHRVPGARLEAMRERALQRTGRPQPDLLGILHAFEGEADRALEIARSLSILPEVEWVRLISLESPPPPPADLSPVTPDLEPQQSHRDPNPGYDVDAAWAVNAKGQGIRLTNVEYGYDPDHEDLIEAGIQDDSPGDMSPEVYRLDYDKHGTASFGVVAAPENGYGVTGIAPLADFHFVSEWLTGFSTFGWDRNSAVAQALTDSGPGDVVLLEMQSPYGVPGGDYGPAELDPDLWTLVQVGVDSGVIVVGASGNGDVDLDDSSMDYYSDRGHSGTILVGAGSDDTGHDKISYSTYGSRIDMQAWGESVLTTGYGSFAEYGNDEQQGYHLFNGSSSAAASVAGAIAALQSYAAATYGRRLEPAEMRNLLVDTGHPQGSGGHIGPALDMGSALRRMDAIETLAVKAIRRVEEMVEIDFDSVLDVLYRLESVAEGETWSVASPSVPGDGGTMTFTTPATGDSVLYRIAIE